MTSHRFSLRKLEDIYGLSETLSQFFPSPEESQLGIYELLLNALEHGNLEIGHEFKTVLIEEGRWETEVRRRLETAPYNSRSIEITVTHCEKNVWLLIKDEGKGFNWHSYLDNISPHFNKSPHGRGLWIALHAGFAMQFNEQGNEVTCVAPKVC